jgi:hypothetical protein
MAARNRMLFHVFIEDKFYPSLERGAPERTAQLYRDALKPMLLPFAPLYLNGITPAVIRGWVQKRSEVVGVASINLSLRVLRRALHLAVEWGFLNKVPKIRPLSGEVQRE